MEARTTVNAEALKEAKMHLVSTSGKIYSAIAAILFTIMVVVELLCNNIFMAAIFLIGAVILSLEPVFIANKIIKVNQRRFAELYGQDSIENVITFEDDGILSKNSVTGGELKMSYGIMAKLIETKNYFAFMTKQRQVLFVDKRQFSEQEKEAFLRIVTEKMPGLKRS